MQPSVMTFIREHLFADEIIGKRILEVGSFDVNGSPRSYVLSRDPKEYIGIDLRQGPGVDQVLDGADAARHFGPESFDAVICAETLEHTTDWKAVVSALKQVLRPGGVLIVTVPAPGFPKHDHPIDNWRWTDDHVRAAFADMRIEAIKEDPAPGVFLRAVKPEHFREANLSYLNIFEMNPSPKTDPPPPPPPEALKIPEGRFINIGCGNFPLHGAENVDLVELQPIAGREGLKVIVADALAYDYSGASTVYAGHFLEHLVVENARAFLLRVYQQALPGAILALTVPVWDRCECADFETLQAMHGGTQKHTGGDHLSAWRTSDIVREMKAAGWREVVEWPDCPWLVALVGWQVCLRGRKPGLPPEKK